MADGAVIRRRTFLAAGLWLAGPARLLAQPQRGPLTFEIWRKNAKIGSHQVSFEGDEKDFTASMAADILVKLGPIPLFHYRHQASEIWRGGRFYSLESHTVTNGRREQVSATASAAGVEIATLGGRTFHGAANVHPWTHWNAAVLEGPLFNPQTGALLHEQVSLAPDQNVRLADGREVQATRYALTGNADISDWYDASDTWTALRGKAPDGSYIDYRRVA